MKKVLTYLVVAVALLALGILIVASSKNRPRKLDERITLRQADKIPYGTSAAKTLLPSLFPDAAIYYNKAHPANWDSIDIDQDNQAVILMADRFSADEEELSRLLAFVKEGNYVFIVAKSFSYEAIAAFRFSYNENSLDQFLNLADDSLRIRLEKPVFATDQLFIYPGKRYESSFYSLDTLRTRVLGRNDEGKPNFIQLKAGRGSLFIHVAPLAFSNYFLLHKNNSAYYQKALSVIPEHVSKVLWNEYYLVKPRKKDQGDPNWLGVLMRYPAFKWGLLTGLATVILFAVLGLRRRQRMIPAYSPPKNDSLDFVKTIGRLYYDKKDHKNLAKKMASYFLDHVRTRYKLSTQILDDAFVQQLYFKSGYALEELRQLIGFVNYLDEMPAISENQLSDFHKQLELFYQNT